MKEIKLNRNQSANWKINLYRNQNIMEENKYRQPEHNGREQINIYRKQGIMEKKKNIKNQCIWKTNNIYRNPSIMEEYRNRSSMEENKSFT